MASTSNDPNELLRLQRELTRSVLLRRERIEQLLQDGELANSPRLQALRRAVDLDSLFVLQSHRQMYHAWHQSRRLCRWLNGMTRAERLRRIEAAYRAAKARDLPARNPRD